MSLECAFGDTIFQINTVTAANKLARQVNGNVATIASRTAINEMSDIDINCISDSFVSMRFD